MSLLLPDGVDDLWDMPWTLHKAVSNALLFIGWQENLQKEDVPPRDIWNDGDKLTAWFRAVDERTREKYGLPPEDKITDPVQNDTKHLLGID